MRAALLVGILILPAFAGCFGSDDAPAIIEEAAVGNDSRDSEFVLPDDRGKSAAAAETNQTEEGVGGVDHIHDYWDGQERIVLFDETIRSSLYPFFPDGPGSNPAGVFYVELPEGALVYEGAGEVIVTVASASATVPLPDFPVRMQYLTAASAEWSDPQAMTYGTPVVIPVSARETDMPHSTQSLWNFRFVVERPPTIYFDRLAVQVVAQRARDVVDWPGHPDFYAAGPHRILFDGAATTKQYGFPENTFYEGQDDWVNPERLISHGTGFLDVYVNITAFRSTNPAAQPSEYILYVHNATDLGIVCCDQTSHDDEGGNNDLKTYWFRVPVHETGMDGPYQPASRWGFRITASIGVVDPTSGGGVGFTDGASYEVDYQMKIVAHKATTSS